VTPLRVHLPDEDATRAFGARVARVLQPGMSVHLIGDLGAGKTTLVRGLLRALGFAGKVKSPTYTLVELYTASSLDLYHFDFYRFRHPSEWHEAGFAEHFNERTVCLVEWPEKAAGLLPPPDLAITLAPAPDGGRDATAAAMTELGTACLERLRAD
jgi:tRNA threonylcarbamoyladenosine biosynthesis protein TsaE